VSGVAFDSAEVCVPFDAAEAQAAGLSEEDLGLYHIGADGIRRNVTTSLDTEAGVVCGRVTSFSPFLVGRSRLDRLAGANRTATAAAIAAQAFGTSAPVVYVATQADYPDALAGGPAAAVTEGPILLVSQNEIPAVTAAALTSLQPGRIVVLGGTAVVSQAVQNQLGQFTDGPVTRLSGTDRYGTAAAISEEVFATGNVQAYIATGVNFPDALAGGAAAAADRSPVLLVRPNAIPPQTAAELERLNPENIVVLGGTSAVSQAVFDELAQYTDGDVEREFGRNRYETAAAILERFDAPVESAYVATGEAFPDALTSVPAAGLTGSPLALVRRDAVPDLVQAQLNRLSPDHLYVLGGNAAVALTLEAALAQALRD
jgi:putative cell wall-binding protein